MLFSQENTVFKFNLFGSTIDEIIASEGPFDEWHWEIFDLDYYFLRQGDENFDRGDYIDENSYIGLAFYNNRYVFDYHARIGYSFNENGICTNCRYIIHLPVSSDKSRHLFIFNDIFNYFIKLYGDQRIKIIEISEKKYILELGNNRLAMSLFTFNWFGQDRAQIYLWYTNN
jgi:hypothetical protein